MNGMANTFVRGTFSCFEFVNLFTVYDSTCGTQAEVEG